MMSRYFLVIIALSTILFGCDDEPDYYVSANVSEGGDGSYGSPFQTINQALEQAAIEDERSVSVSIDRGVYPENIIISRPTTFTGDGRESTKLIGSIVNSHYKLKLKHFFIAGATNRAVSQSGGMLEIEDITIEQTQLVDGDPSSGLAIELSGGIFASLKNVHLKHNMGRALFITGEGTKVYASNLKVTENRVNPIAITQAEEIGFHQTGAIEVAENAKLFLQDSTIIDNEIAGVLIRDGGLAHIRNSSIGGTKQSQHPESDLAGHNIVVVRNGKLEMHRFITENANACGIIIDTAYLKISDGQVRSNRIGIGVFGSPEAGYDPYKCVSDDVIFADNETRIGTGVIPLPDPTTTTPPYCPGVPWE